MPRWHHAGGRFLPPITCVTRRVNAVCCGPVTRDARDSSPGQPVYLHYLGRMRPASLPYHRQACHTAIAITAPAAKPAIPRNKTTRCDYLPTG